MFKITSKNYKRTIDFFKAHKRCRIMLKIIYSYLPLLLFIGYPILIVCVFFSRPNDIFKIVLVPLGVFLLVTALRKIINAPRPYEKYGAPSVFDKKTKGQSMPSRHTASAFIISLAMVYVNHWIGAAALAVSFLIMLSRVLAGVHFVRDTLAAMCLSIFIGTLFFFAI